MVGGPGAAGAPASSPRSPGSGEAAERWRWEAAAAAAQGRPRPPSLSRPRRRPRDGPSSQSRRRRLGLATLPARRGGRPLRPPSAPKKARAMRAPCSGRPGPSAWSLLPHLASHFRPQDPRRGLGLSGRAGRLRDPGRRTAAPARRSPRPCSPAGLRRCFGGGVRPAAFSSAPLDQREGKKQKKRGLEGGDEKSRGPGGQRDNTSGTARAAESDILSGELRPTGSLWTWRWHLELILGNGHRVGAILQEGGPARWQQVLQGSVRCVHPMHPMERVGKQGSSYLLLGPVLLRPVKERSSTQLNQVRSRASFYAIFYQPRHS